MRSGDPLSEGSFEKLFSQPAPTSGGPCVVPSGSETTPPPPWQQEQNLEPSPKKSHPRATRQDIPHSIQRSQYRRRRAAAILPKRRSDGDVLDEMFSAEAKKGGPPSRSKVIFLSLLGAVAIITTVLVIVAPDTMGGWKLGNPAEEEPVTTGTSIDTADEWTDRYRDDSGGLTTRPSRNTILPPPRPWPKRNAATRTAPGE